MSRDRACSTAWRLPRPSSAAFILKAALIVGTVLTLGLATAPGPPAGAAPPVVAHGLEAYGPITPPLTIGVSGSCGSVVVSGMGTPGATVNITLTVDSTQLVATTTVGANGNYSVVVNIQCGVTTTIKATEPVTAQSASLTVSSPAPTHAGGTSILPHTGADIAAAATVAALAIGAGGVLVLAARRRRRYPAGRPGGT